jgi:hypothetical protein
MTHTTTNITEEQKERLLTLVSDLAGKWPAADWGQTLEATIKAKIQSDFGLTSYLDLTQQQFDELLAFLTIELETLDTWRNLLTLAAKERRLASASRAEALRHEQIAAALEAAAENLTLGSAAIDHPERAGAGA